jgi:hypothetical protein
VANLKKATEVAKQFGEKAVKALDAIGKPQRILLDTAAKAMGQEGSATNSEESAAQIADAVVSKFVPEDSEYLGPALKAAGTAGLETFADPTGPILGGLQKVAKGVKMGVKAVNALGKGAETAETIYRRTKPVRATEEINRVKNAAETYVGRKGLADKAAQEQARSLAKIEKEAQSMGKMQNPEAQFVDMAARQKALDARAQEAAVRNFGTQVANAKTTDEVEQLRARMEVFKDLFKKHNQ